ncbi:hypothetical protein POTOM_015801 [Populus tomentosa]|uniref:ENTH/VHS/GAT family protein n=1 Tax=Populus tomentosa TaxID=118781 RepID=A0A8X8CXF2_POPTO|nr:hypothetical protein POTOM_015801 [Populus tomentosa]
MAAELVNSATNDKLVEVDWTKNIEICELVAHDERQARDVIKAIKKRLGSKNANTQLYAVMLLEMLMNNIGEQVHRQVIDTGILPVLVKIVKKKTELPIRERVFLLLDATQTSLGGASGKFPQYYTAYYDLVVALVPLLTVCHRKTFYCNVGLSAAVIIPAAVTIAQYNRKKSAGMQFPQRPRERPSSERPSNNQTAQGNKKITLNGELAASRHEMVAQPAPVEPQVVPESSIIQKASNALEVLKEVLDAVDSQNGAKNEFTLDLVEQCSFQKQRVMHLVMTSRDEKLVSRSIELNEQLQKVLARHDALLSGRSTVSDRNTFSNRTATAPNHFNHEESEEEEEPEQLFRRYVRVIFIRARLVFGENENANFLFREETYSCKSSQYPIHFCKELMLLRKGKACARPEDEGNSEEHLPLGIIGSTIPGERLNRPLIRPLPSEQPQEPSAHPAPVVIPPPPAKHIEREKFFQEKKVDGSDVDSHMGGLSLHSRNASSSHGGSIDFGVTMH